MADARGPGIGKETATAVRLEFQRPDLRTLVISSVVMSCGNALRAEVSSVSGTRGSAANAPAVIMIEKRMRGATLFMANRQKLSHRRAKRSILKPDR